MLLCEAWIKAPTAAHTLNYQKAARLQSELFKTRVDGAVTAAPSATVATGCVPS